MTTLIYASVLIYTFSKLQLVEGLFERKLGRNEIWDRQTVFILLYPNVTHLISYDGVCKAVPGKASG